MPPNIPPASGSQRVAATDSTDSAADTKAKIRYAYKVALLAGMGGFLFGYDLSIISGALAFLREAFDLSKAAEGFAVSSAAMGCIAGPLLAVPFSDGIGRRRALLVAATLLAIGTLGSAFPTGMTMFGIFRIIGGVGVGIASVVSPMYISEMAPAKLRGRLVAVNQLALVTGLFLANVVAWVLASMNHWHTLNPTESWHGIPASIVANVGNWHMMFLSVLVPVSIWIIGLFFLPESPRWLVMRKKEEAARALLHRVESPEEADLSIEEIRASLAEESGSYKELLNPGIRMALVAAIGLGIFQQATGPSVLLTYAPTVFLDAKLTDTTDSIGLAVLLNFWMIACTALAFWLVDRLGRRPLLLTGCCGMAGGLAALAIFMDLGWKIPAVIAVFIAVGSFVSTLAPLAWLIMAEIFPTRIRGRAMAIAGGALWISLFVAEQLFPSLTHHFTQTTGSPAPVFWIFSGVCVACFVFSWKFIPETKGRTLEEIGSAWLHRGGKKEADLTD